MSSNSTGVQPYPNCSLTNSVPSGRYFAENQFCAIDGWHPRMSTCCSALSDNATVYRNLDWDTNDEGCVSWCEIATDDPVDDLQQCLKAGPNFTGAGIIVCSKGVNEEGAMSSSASDRFPKISMVALLSGALVINAMFL